MASSLLTSIAAYYKLDESSGNASDSSGAGLTLTNGGTATYSAGKINNGVNGGSSNSTKSLSRDANTPVGVSYAQYTVAWSLSCWVNQTTQNASDQDFIGFQVQSGANQRMSWYLRNLSSSQTLRLAVSDNGANTYDTSFTTWNTGTWYHVVITYDGSTFKVYVNNASVLSQARATTPNGTAGAGSFGILCQRQSAANFNYFSGLVDEVGVWTKVLSAIEIQSLYNNGNGVAYPLPNIGLSETVTDTDTLSQTKLALHVAVTETVTDTDSLSSSLYHNPWRYEGKHTSSWSYPTKH